MMNGIRPSRSVFMDAVIDVAAIVAASVLLIICFTFSACAESYTYTDNNGINWEYSYYNQMIQINGCDKIPESGELCIPEDIGGEPVQRIAYRAFSASINSNNENIKSIILPDSILSIGDQAFLGCRISSFKCPENLIYIGEQAFQNCKSLTAVALNSNLETLKNNSFGNCTGLTRIHIAKNINTIESYTFNGCTNLKYVTADASSQFFKAVDNVLYSKNGETLVLYPPAREGTSFSIPNGVTDIGAYSFNGAKIRSVTIPSTVHTLDSGVFYHCENLSEVVFEEVEGGSALESVGNYAFCGCKALMKIELPDKTRSIGENCFAYSEKLCVIELPDSVGSIGARAFTSTLIDQNFRIPSGVSTIQRHTFDYCPNLKHLIIPDTVQSIEEEAFIDCFNLSDVYIASSETLIGSGAFVKCGTYDSDIQKRTFALAGGEGSSIEEFANNSGFGFSAMTESEYKEAIAADTPIYNFEDYYVSPDENGNGETGGNTERSVNSDQSGATSINDRSGVTSNPSSNTKTTTSAGAESGTITGTKILPSKEKVKKSKKLGKPKFKAKNKKGKKIKLSWKKVKGADGYLLYVKGPKDRKYVRRVTMNAKVKSITHKGLIKGKKYKYKLAAYKVVKGKKVRGPFSKTITVKVKK